MFEARLFFERMVPQSGMTRKGVRQLAEFGPINELQSTVFVEYQRKPFGSTLSRNQVFQIFW